MIPATNDPGEDPQQPEPPGPLQTAIDTGQLKHERHNGRDLYSGTLTVGDTECFVIIGHGRGT